MSSLLICNTIRELREGAGYTQAYVSRLLNIQRQTYSNYENATRTPPLEIIVALAELYHVSVDYLIRGSDAEPAKAAGTSSGSSLPQNSPAHKLFNDFSSLSKDDQKEVIDFVRFKKSLADN